MKTGCCPKNMENGCCPKTLKLVGVQKNAKWILSKKTWKLVAVQKLKYETRCFPKKTEKFDVFQKLKARYFPKNLIN